jgi:hypothetical protein
MVVVVPQLTPRLGYSEHRDPTRCPCPTGYALHPYGSYGGGGHRRPDAGDPLRDLV